MNNIKTIQTGLLAFYDHKQPMAIIQWTISNQWNHRQPMSTNNFLKWLTADYLTKFYKRLLNESSY